MRDGSVNFQTIHNCYFDWSYCVKVDGTASYTIADEYLELIGNGNPVWEVIPENHFPPPREAALLLENPKLISPKHDSNITVDTVSFFWMPVQMMSGYRLQIAFDSTLNSNLLDITVFDTTASIRDLVKRKRYFWRVCGVNTEGESRWSEVWSFRTGEQAEVKDAASREPALTCYPNPASKEITIGYGITDGSPAKIFLYDMGGKLCKSQDIFAGHSETRLDVSELASGMYVVGIVSGARRESCLIEIHR
jgi:hypothetical protein